MEHLSIKNFLCVKEVDFEVGRFNIIIGSQASGKSVITKLLYFFREVIYYISLFHELSSQKIEKNRLSLFKDYFPEYAWRNQNFKLTYRIQGFEITLNNEDSIKIIFSPSLLKQYALLSNDLEGSINKQWSEKVLKRLLFIPASRAFFSHIQNNIFLLLKNDINIDPFVKDFGSHYEALKQEYNEIKLDKKIDLIFKQILKGKYIYDASGEEWIEQNNQRISLFHASSGQQSAIPMLLMLSLFATTKLKNGNAMIFIEKYEAHLFPVAQKQSISLMSFL